MASRPTVLLVEDDPLLLDALTHTLERRGYRVLTAADGNVAMVLSAEHRPDIALLEMMLPGRSGFQVAQALKGQPGGNVFVVMMSGNSSAAHRDYAFASGVDRFLAKPFSTAKLMEVLEGVFPATPSARIRGEEATARVAAIPA